MLVSLVTPRRALVVAALAIAALPALAPRSRPPSTSRWATRTTRR